MARTLGLEAHVDCTLTLEVPKRPALGRIDLKPGTYRRHQILSSDDGCGGIEMHDVLKALNDRGPCEIRALDAGALRRFEALCETWAKIAEAEIARRNALPLGELRRHGPAPAQAGAKRI